MFLFLRYFLFVRFQNLRKIGLLSKLATKKVLGDKFSCKYTYIAMIYQRGGGRGWREGRCWPE